MLTWETFRIILAYRKQVTLRAARKLSVDCKILFDYAAIFITVFSFVV